VVVPEDHFLLLSLYQDKSVTKTSKYRTALAAPIRDDDVVCYLIYGISTFQNPVIKEIHAVVSIKKAKRIQVIRDSILNLIFGTGYWSNKQLNHSTGD
jgi:hypothetical protein